jgi:hypothetical protein
MTKDADPYAELRKRLVYDGGPTPGPWYGSFDGVRLAPDVFGGGRNTSMVVCGVCCTTGRSESETRNAMYIAAANPQTIAALLAERDQLAALLKAKKVKHGK